MPTPTVKEVDIVQGSCLTWDEKGPYAKRRFRVDGLRGIPSYQAQGTAMLALGNAGVFFAASHPGISGVYCSRVYIEPFANGNDSVFATAEYVTAQRNPAVGGSYTVRVTSANGTRIQSYDGTGKLLKVTWNDPTDGQDKNCYVNLRLESSNSVIEISRQEQNSPLQLSRTYRNRVNSTPMWGFQKNELLCRSIDGEVLLGANSLWIWQVTYRFEGGPSIIFANGQSHSVWESVEVFRDMTTGRIPDHIDVTDGTDNGYKYFLGYSAIDFSPLGLPDITA